MPVKVISDLEAIKHISQQRFACYLGAGVSAEANIKTANTICNEIRDQELALHPELDAAGREAWANDNLSWDDPSGRYSACMRAYSNEAGRVVYFRDMLRRKQPCFAHHAVALLMWNKTFKNTCLTTNFDHLLESAFVEQGEVDIQAIRSDTECQYWRGGERERYFVIKLHGDIDTENILNTTPETISISDPIFQLVRNVTSDSGLVVLGTAGNEKSIIGLFDRIGRGQAGPNQPLSFGLFWGVYMGPSRPAAISAEDLRKRVESRIKETQIHKQIVAVINDSKNDLFCFFPVWGAGAFLKQVIDATSNRRLIGTAYRYLDHEMRLRHVFANAGLSEETIDKHLETLREKRRRTDAASEGPTQKAVPVFKATTADASLELRVLYGDITSRTLMDADEFKALRGAVVSPEDTCISAGGGVAYGLAAKAGVGVILNELSKFTKVPQRSVVVTSGGNLPVEYIFHAAALKIEEGVQYSVSPDDIVATTLSILDKAAALEVGILWVPLIGGGVASVEPSQSFDAILRGIKEWRASAGPAGRPAVKIAVVIYEEGQLPRRDVNQAIQAMFGAELAPQPVKA